MKEVVKVMEGYGVMSVKSIRRDGRFTEQGDGGGFVGEGAFKDLWLGQDHFNVPGPQLWRGEDIWAQANRLRMTADVRKCRRVTCCEDV